MAHTFRKATIADHDQIWEILQAAILRRKLDGSQQWQDGYPNPDLVIKDIYQQAGFVLEDAALIVGYCAIFVNDEPAYKDIEGTWLSDGDFIAVHRVAIASNYLGKGLAREIMLNIEEHAIKENIYSIKADTNFDNPAMMNIFDKLGYLYCGEVFFRGNARRAYEKILTTK
ncbi:MAG: GNAT family N-acetyltransferase [Bacteroidota bacterium]